MAIINGVDFSRTVDDAIEAARAIVTDNWDEVRDILRNIGEGLSNDIAFIAQKKTSREFNEDDARVFLEDQKMLARIRLRSIAIITLQLAEQIWNAVANIFRAAIRQALGGWSIL